MGSSRFGYAERMQVQITHRLDYVPTSGDPVHYERSGTRTIDFEPFSGARYKIGDLPSRAVNGVTLLEGGGVLIDLEQINEQEGLGSTEIEAEGFTVA